MSFNRKQNAEAEITRQDENDLIYAYFEFCSSHFKSKYEEYNVIMNVRLVAFPSQCTGKYKEFAESVNQGLDMLIYFNVIIYILALIGLVGNILSLSVFCRSSFIAAHHIAYYCIARSIYDISMLMFCVIVSYHRGHTDVSISYSIHERSDLPETYVDNLMCLALFGLFMPSELGTAYLTLTLSFGRFFSTAFPFKAMVYLTHRIAKRVTIVVVIITVLVPLCTFLPTYLLYGFGAECITFNRNPTGKHFLYFTIVWTCVVILLPWILVLSFTIVTGFKMQEAAVNRQQMMSGDAINPNDVAQDKRIKLMSMAIASSFLVALVPEIILNAFGIVHSLNKLSLTKATELSGVIVILLGLKSSLGFFVYFATDVEFRQAIMGYCRKLKNLMS